MNVFEWIRAELRLDACTSDRFIYDDMDSQSGRCLPIIYQPFDARQKSHWRDRGAAFDYLFATQGEGKRLLDFGPGDGWPSLIVAPFAREVVGVDGSRRRVEVCTANAARLGIPNASFVYVAPGTPLPFEDDSFDGVTAASSVEQTPDPRRTLAELFRVLRPGGRLRIHYESLNGYRGDRERDACLWQIDEHRCRLILYDRDIDAERVVQYGLTYGISGAELKTAASDDGGPLSFEKVTVPFLEKTRRAIIDARLCTTIHPSGRTLASWLRNAGFRKIIPSHNGLWASGELYGHWPEGQRPQDLDGVDRLLRPVVKTVVKMPAPIDTDPMITAVK